MEEKKTTKISLSTFFLILAIIAICVMGYFIYKLNDDKTKATDQVQSLNSQIANLEKSIDNLKVNISESKTEGTSTKSNNSSTINTNFELKGTYQWINPEGPTMTYTFSNGTFTYTETATSKGTYEISGNKVKIKFDETTDIDGSKYKLPDTEGIIDGNTLIIGDITLTKVTFELSGTYQWINPEGPTMTYTFSNGTFTYTETATSKGTYEVSGNKVKIKFDETTDIDGSKYKLPDTEGTINGNTLIIGDITLTKK